MKSKNPKKVQFMWRGHQDLESERRRNALASLSTVGAALAGAGVGIAFSGLLGPAMWPMLIGGTLAHVVGMVGVRQLGARSDFQPSPVETIGYWACWVIVAFATVYALIAIVL